MDKDINEDRDFVLRDGPGRRGYDKCPLHDYIECRNAKAFDGMEADVNILRDKTDAHIKSTAAGVLVQERELKDLADKYVSKWVLGLLLTIVLTVFTYFIRGVSYQVKNIHTDVKIISDRTHDMAADMVRFDTIQQVVVENQHTMQIDIDSLGRRTADHGPRD